MIIGEIYLKGFQGHVNTHIKLSGGFTVITGATDAGKTSIMKSVRWVCLGEPQGEAFVNSRVGSTEVKLVLSSGYTISKRRENGSTFYTITAPFGASQTYQMAKVPDEVPALTGITKATFVDFEESLNFAFQFEEPFLISKPPSSSAKVLGAIANVSDVDGALKGAGGYIAKQRNTMSFTKTELEQKNSDILRYHAVDPSDNALKVCEKKLEQLDRDVNASRRLEELKDSHSNNTSMCDRISDDLRVIAKVDELSDKAAVTNNNLQNLERLVTVFKSVARLNDDLAAVSKDLNKLQTIESIAGLTVDLSRRVDTYDILGTVVTSRSKLRGDLCKTEAALKVLSNLQELELRARGLGSGTNNLSAVTQINSEYQRVKNCEAGITSKLGKLTSVEELTTVHLNLTDISEKLGALSLINEKLGYCKLGVRGTIQRLEALMTLDKFLMKSEDICARLYELKRYEESQKLYNLQLRAIDDLHRKELRVDAESTKVQQEYEKLWSEMGCCPMGGEDYCPIMKNEQIKNTV